MPHYLKLFISVVLCVFTLGLMGCNDYTPNPEDDIALFQPFIDDNINKKSDDPYLSSTVKPGDKLYDILVNIQHGRHDVAIKELEPLVEQGDAEAQFWMAKMIFRSSVKNIRPAIRLYEQSAKKNNPYSQFELSPEGQGCLAYFGDEICTKENLNKAIDMFKQQAKQGDLRAQYFLLRMLKPDGSVIEHETYFSNNYNFTHSAESRQHYLKEVIRFAENHYYQPLMDYVDTLLTRPQGELKFVAKTQGLYKLALELLSVASNNNYIPAINWLVALKKENLTKDDPLYTELYKLGGTYYFHSRSFSFLEQYPPKEQYVFALAFEKMSGSREFFIGLKYSPNSEKEKFLLNNQADLLLKNMTPMVYIDGFTSRDKWVD